ncbi:MAG: acyltransferase [Bacteroidetes bacterium]|nr:acyltransferase [Bacteroidota bacterium]
MEITQKNLAVSDFNSRKIKFWTFLSMFLLVFVHGYNLHERYMQPWTIPGEALNLTTFTEYFLANGIFRFRIPMLFIISGFLYAMHDFRPYGQRTKKRLRTLLLPYLIWSALGFAFTYFLELYPFTRDIVSGSNIVRIDDQRALLHDYHWYEMLARWILIPVPYQLWFIRVLLIYNIAYPAIRWCVTNRIARWVFFTLSALMWLGTMGFIFFEGEGLLFFSLGIWMQKTNFNIDFPARWLNPWLWGIIFIVLAAIKTVLAFLGQPVLGEAIFPVLSLLHKLVILSGLIAAWYGCNGLVAWCMHRKWFVWLTAFSFIIYAVHAPLIAYAIEALFAVVNQVPHYRLLSFILLPLTVAAMAVGTGFLLRKTWPGLYGILTGGRGF